MTQNSSPPGWVGGRLADGGWKKITGIFQQLQKKAAIPSLWAGEVPKKHVHSHKTHQVEYKEKEAQGHSEGFAFAVISGDSSNLTTLHSLSY